MSHITNRDTTRPAGSIDQRLARWLDSPGLARVVPQLPPETLHQLIRTRGLDACSALVQAATPAQLTAVLDLDLWRPAHAGRDEQFDVDRFGDWLEALADTSDAAAARTVASLDPGLIVAGLSRYIRVFDPGIFEPTAPSDDESIAPGDAMHDGDDRDDDGMACEVAGYVVRARRDDAWDAVVTLLVALDADHPDAFQAIMRGCRQLSNSRPEVDGLDDLFQAPEQQRHILAMQRDRRRADVGYATPADARAFLEMARRRDRAGAHPIAAAWMRTSDAREPAMPAETAPTDDAAAGATTSAAEVMAWLVDAGVMPEPPRALLAAANSEPAPYPHLHRFMDARREAGLADIAAHQRALALLANALVAGGSVQSRAFTPSEAADAAASTCNLGLELVPQAPDLVTAFEIGWSWLHREVSLAAADQIAATLTEVRVADRDVRRELTTCARALAAQRAAGTPWRAADAADALLAIDATVWMAVRGLLGECPVVADALTAIVERRVSAVSPTAFCWFASTAQLRSVRTFLRTLPALVTR